MAPLPNTLASLQQLRESPSAADGIPADLEEELRVYGCQLIQQAGVLLKLPQVAMATAQVLFQRFWFVSSMKHFGIQEIGMGALFLACKLEEQSLRIRDLINVFDFLSHRAMHNSRCNPGPRALEYLGIVKVGDTAKMAEIIRSEIMHNVSSTSTDLQADGTVPQPVAPYSKPHLYTPDSYFSSAFYDTKDAIAVAEMQILKRLGFNVQVVLPFATLVNYLKLFGLTETSSPSDDADAEVAAPAEGTRPQPSFAQRAWSFLNDALQTTLYCQYPPHVLACGAIYLTALTHRPKPIVLPTRPRPWWELFDVEAEEDLRIISATLLRLYDASGWLEFQVEQGHRSASPATRLSLGQMGLASRVRDEWGGMANLLTRQGVRKWLERQNPPAESTSDEQSDG